MNQIADRVRKEVTEAIEKDQLVLPTLPEVALRVREVAEDPDASIHKLTQVIGNDAKMALMRLGIEYTCNLATGLAMEQMFQATSDMVDRRLREVWNRSSEIAGICHVLCRHQTELRPDQATLAGLIHKIGVLPILTYAEEHPRLLRDSITLDDVIDSLHPIIGDQILRKWEFPQELCKVPREHLNFQRQVSNADYADIVTVAMLQSYMGSDHSMAQVDYTQVTAFERLGLDPDMQFAEAQDLSEEMEAAMSLLQ
ncbi:MAG: HDOD domain-containing protein [Exilibacterium sp.]